MKLITPRTATAFLAATTVVASFGLTAGASAPPDKDALTLVQDASTSVAGASMRFDVAMDLTGAPISFGDGPLMTGAAAGTSVEMSIDLGAIFEAGGIDPTMFGIDDASMQLRVLDGTDVYVRGGLFALVGQLDPSFTQFAALGDGWGHVDANQVPDFDQLISEMSGAGNPTEALTVLDAVQSAEIVGTEDIDGETMTVVRITVSGAELEKITGPDNPFAGADITVPYDLYIDAAGYPRQMVINLDSETLSAADEENAFDGMAISMTMTMRFFDYHDESIVIEAPADAIDVTADFITMSAA